MKIKILKSILIIFFMSFYSCINRVNTPNVYLSDLKEEDSIFVENELKSYKKCLFALVYSKSKKADLQRRNIANCDYDPKDLTYYFFSDFNPEWLSKNNNQDNLINKWLTKEEYVSINQGQDFPEGSLDLARALDFYESDDLEKFIDSLRITEYKRLKKINKKN